MAEYLSPGVYVEEFDSGVKAMEGVGTSTAGFVGMAQKGPIRGLPILITSMADYQRRFGGYLSERVYGGQRFLPYAVEQFFNNGGSACYVMRVCLENDGSNETKDGAVAAQGILKAGDTELLTLKAANPGAWGNDIQARLAPVLKNRTKIKKQSEGEENTYEIEAPAGYAPGDIVCIQYTEEEKKTFFNIVKKAEKESVSLEWAVTLPADEKKEAFLYLLEWNMMLEDSTAAEQYESVSFNRDRSNYVDHMLKKSQLVTGTADMEKQLAEEMLSGLLQKDGKSSVDISLEVSFGGGSDGVIKPDAVDASLYEGTDGAPDVRTGLMAFKTLSDVSIMAIPGITDDSVQSALVSHCEGLASRFAILDMPFDKKEVSELQAVKEKVDSGYAAMYHPWLQCYDPLANRKVFMPPSGAMAGIYARTDNARGVHKAPANEVVRNCTDLSVKYNEAEQGKLNPKGINLIRAIPGQGIRVWGARTCSSDGNWKYVNVRRLFIFLEESIKANTNWAVFEPNDETLWSRVEGTIRVFLTTQWRNGALAGSTADEAFYVNIGRSTMTEDDILNGRLICVIGVAPVRPAEFVIFRITQKMESAQ
ncbi:MAG: phage tail sheath subtilisin-like domain-containing protein [Butyrivibrio sp.]|nr:phage tail sheath subtilisin-like domain-containing protein [Acetatifactor muris]MCM1560020.1 phage tail sheath subtilisin-like domain-containing protein [Butyrivibrio sp.]